MQTNYLTKKLEKSIIIIIFVFFAGIYLYLDQYLISFLTLPLVLFAWRISDIRKISVTSSGLYAEFSKIRKRAKEVVRSEKDEYKKVKEIQDLIDRSFKAGYISGGAKVIGDINNVKIKEDKDGNITSIQYDEC